jgi:hypothetical protein
MSTGKPLITLSAVERWRLLLGEAAAPSLQGGIGQSQACLQMDRTLAWLYGRDDAAGKSDTLDRHGGDSASQLTVPEWINDIHELFPKETIERLERDAIERYGIDEIVTNADVLERAQPNPALLEAVLRTKHLMKPEVLEMARRLVARVVQELLAKLAKEVVHALSGTRRRRRLTLRGSYASFAARETLRHNLKHYDPKSRRMVIARPLFHQNIKRSIEPWQVILLVDQSGSMVSSVIHSAVTAACLWNLPGIKTHLIAFDTEVVDLTHDVQDPVELLMRVQLGGGTHIGKAVGYAADIIETPRRAIVVLISDFYEGMPQHVLIDHVRALIAQGTIVLGLAALDDKADAAYDAELAGKLVELGAHFGAMTPGQLANWLAEKLG